MRRNRAAVSYLILWLVLVVCARVAMAKTHAQGESSSTPARVFFSPDLVELSPGVVRTVNVVVENVSDLYGAKVRISFPHNLAQVVDADAGMAGIQIAPGDLFDGFPTYTVLNGADNTRGSIEYIVSMMGVAGGVGSIPASPGAKSGSGVLATIAFTAASPAAGSGMLAFAEVVLAERDGTSISYEDGQATIRVVGATSTPTPTTTPVTPTATGTAAPPVATHTPSPTPTPKATFTPSATLTATRTATPSPTGTPTRTATPSPTVVGTVPTATATASPTLATTASPTPTATPTPTTAPTGVLVCTNFVQNPGFENIVNGAAPPWEASPLVTFTRLESHSGERSALLGGYNGALDKICQEIVIPPYQQAGQVTVQAVLTYTWAMWTAEPTHPFDFLYVRLRKPNGDLITTLEVLSDASVAAVWQQSGPFDLMEYAGQTVALCFETLTDSTNPTSFYVDDVTVRVCQLVSPTPTPTPSPSPSVTPTPTQPGAPTATPTITPTPVEVALQNQVGGYQGCDDTFIESWAPAANHGHEGAFAIRTFGIKRPLIRFDLSTSIPSGVIVLEARLWLRATHYKSNPHHSLTIDAYALKRAWVEKEATWEHWRSEQRWEDPGADGDDDRYLASSGSFIAADTSVWYAMDLTALAQDWVSGTKPNHGVLLLATGNTVETSFYSSEYSEADKRPKLVIRYVHGAALTPTSTPGVTPTFTPGPSPTPTATATPALGGVVRIFQQSLLGYDGVADTYINQWSPDEKRGFDAKVAVRQGGVFKTLIRFDLSELPQGATIEEAKLGLYAYGRSNAGGMDVRVYPVLRSWSEGQATWNDATASVTWGQPGCSQAGVDRGDLAATTVVNAVNTWHEWDVTPLVQTWVSKTAPNQGMILVGEGATSVEYLFASSDYWWDLTISPRLTVRYSTS